MSRMSDFPNTGEEMFALLRRVEHDLVAEDLRYFDTFVDMTRADGDVLPQDREIQRLRRMLEEGEVRLADAIWGLVDDDPAEYEAFRADFERMAREEAMARIEEIAAADRAHGTLRDRRA